MGRGKDDPHLRSDLREKGEQLSGIEEKQKENLGWWLTEPVTPKILPGPLNSETGNGSEVERQHHMVNHLPPAPVRFGDLWRDLGMAVASWDVGNRKMTAHKQAHGEHHTHEVTFAEIAREENSSL